MKAILAALTLTIQELKTKANAALSGMLPLDQYNGSKEVSYALNTLTWVQKEVEDMLKSVEDITVKYAPEVKAAAEALLPEMITARIAAGEFVAKADSEAAISAAELRGRQTAEAAFQLREQEAATIASRRLEIVTAHGAEVAASVSDEALKGEGFDDFKTELSRRVNSLGAIGVTAATKKTAFADIACGIPFDETGKTAFDTRLESIKELVGPVKPGTATAAASAQRPTVPGSGQPTAPARVSETAPQAPTCAF
jgi:hypothetical protein